MIKLTENYGAPAGLTADRLQNYGDDLNKMKAESRKFEQDLASEFSHATDESDINQEARENVLDFKIT